MLKLTIAVLAVALAGSASAAGWRSLRVDGSSDDGFAKSIAEFQEKLTPVRRYVFASALHDIWDQGTKNAAAEQREYTDDDYLRQLDGLGYDEVVTFTDPTGDTAQKRYREGRDVVYAAARRNTPSRLPDASFSQGVEWPTFETPIVNGNQMRGGVPGRVP